MQVAITWSYALEILVCITYSSSICAFSTHYKCFQEEISLTVHFYEELFPYIWNS